MVIMWMLMILVWRMLSKVLRRFGRWPLVVPVAALGAAVFGLNVWTAATVLLALLLAVLLALVLVSWRQAGTSSLLPVTMLGAGICGLWAAASMARSWAAAGFSVWNAFTVQIPRLIVPAKAGLRGAAYVPAASQAAAKVHDAIAAQVPPAIAAPGGNSPGHRPSCYPG